MNKAAILLFFFSLPAFAADPPIMNQVKAMKGNYFNLRAHESILGNPNISAWDSRQIYTYSADSYPEWKGKTFVSERQYFIKDVNYNKKYDQLVIKMWSNEGHELKLSFQDAKSLKTDAFEQKFYELFFRPDENVLSYVAENNEKLIKEYFRDAGLSGLPHEEQLALLKAAQYAGKTASPKIERLQDGFYLHTNLLYDPFVYNDLQVNKIQRLASSVESKIAEFKRIESKTNDLSILKGICFYWIIQHRDFLNEGTATMENIKIYVPLDDLGDFSVGNLSAYELMGKSLAQVDGTKISFTSWDPIGAR
jgi:hypothetical protein